MSTASEQIQRVRTVYGDDWGRFAESWVGYAVRTVPIESSVIVPAIENLYDLAGYGRPRVVIVSSPGVLAFAGTFAAEVWARRTTNPTFDPANSISAMPAVAANCKNRAAATLSAFRAATASPQVHNSARNLKRTIRDAMLATTYDPADLATVNALSREVWGAIRSTVEEMTALNYWNECIRDAMRDEFGNTVPTDVMVSAAQDWAQPLAVALFGEGDAHRIVGEAADWWRHSQAGNVWLYDMACIAAARDVHKLSLPEHRSFTSWESGQINGGYRYLHPEFCLVSDFPEALDEASMVHSTQVRHRSLQQRQAAPVIRWRDGWLV